MGLPSAWLGSSHHLLLRGFSPPSLTPSYAKLLVTSYFSMSPLQYIFYFKIGIERYVSPKTISLKIDSFFSFTLKSFADPLRSHDIKRPHGHYCPHPKPALLIPQSDDKNFLKHHALID